MKTMKSIVVVTPLAIGAALFVACAEKGKSGSEGIDCGDHGSAHGDHCHCNEGYFFDGVTCVAPGEITEVCTAEAADAGEADTTAATEAEHHHEACVCPTEGDCPCDGEISTYGGKDYCSPELDEE
jgi:hypothetical protein